MIFNKINTFCITLFSFFFQLDVASSELEVYLSGYKKLQDRFEQAKEKHANIKTQKTEKQRYVLGG